MLQIKGVEKKSKNTFEVKQLFLEKLCRL